MTTKWIKTPHKGLRYYEHETRRHGKKKDRYYSIRYRLDGKDYEYGIGWWSDGVPEEVKKDDHEIGFEDYALKRLREYKANKKDGSGPQSPKERREAAEKKAVEEKAEQERLAQEGITFTDYFEKTYLPDQKGNKKPNTIRVEKGLFNIWIKPIIGERPYLYLAETDLKRIKSTMQEKKKSEKTIHHALGLVRHVLYHSKHPEIFKRADVKLPKLDNAKAKYLSAQEINQLLTALKEKSMLVHDQALIAVNCGLRFSEVAGLRWEDVNYVTGTIFIRDAKTGSRTVFLNKDVSSSLKARQGKKKTGLVFPVTSVRKDEKRGEPQERCSKTFQRVADKLFNEGITDRRQRITFHSLRHTFGTHVYENSGDLYLTQKALGHKTMVMAQRYAKMSESKLREAFDKMTEVLRRGKVQKEEGEIAEERA